MPDIIIENHGSVVFLCPVTSAGGAWIEENIGQDSGYQPRWPNVLIEPRYVESVIVGMITDGLLVT